MRTLTRVVLLCGLLASAPPAVARSWSSLLRKHGFEERQVGLVVLDSRGTVRGALGAGTPLCPASNQKLLVVGAALDVLGSDFKYTTLLWSTRAPVGGTLPGDLVVTGDGDPNNSGRFTDGDTTAIFRIWASELRKKGIRRITGDLLVDDFSFDDERFLPVWKSDQWSRWYSAEIGALSFNDNCVDVTVVPASVGSLAGVRVQPATAYVSIENRCRTVGLTAKTKRPAIVLDRVRGTNHLVLKGKVARQRNGEWTGHVTVEDPGLYYGTVLREVLARSGVDVVGAVVRDRSRLAPPADRVLLHRHVSPLRLDIPVILGRSQNLHSEILLKVLGHSTGVAGSVETGAAVLREHLRRRGIPTAGFHVADGSGFSPKNRVTATTLARLLHQISRQKYFPLFRDSLPVGGKSGTLRRRFRDQSLRGRVLAKTGSIAGVSALSGYVFTAPREPVASPGRSPEPSAGAAATGPFWTFSLLVNGFPRKRGAVAAHELQEDVVREILRRMEPN